MIRQNEIFIQLLDGSSGKPAAALNQSLHAGSGQPNSVSVPATAPAVGRVATR
jgi:cell division protein FtsB